MLLAVDPGTALSGYCLMNFDYTIEGKGKVYNEFIIENLGNKNIKTVVIEKAVPFSMVPKTLLDTVMWYGRFIQAAFDRNDNVKVILIPRATVKKHICDNGRANDSMVRAEIIRSFGQPKTSNSDPVNPIYNDEVERMKADIWQAFALGVTYADSITGRKLISPANLNRFEYVENFSKGLDKMKQV